jgi:clan AA aspartic protease (TIGR02281 family)
VEAVVNGRLTVPLRVDTGAELTVLTKKTAEAIPIAALPHLPRHQVQTASGPATMPVTSLRSLRVGSAEARDVTVAIDLDGRLPVGLLGLSFLRRFTVRVDPASGQVTFERAVTRQDP